MYDRRYFFKATTAAATSILVAGAVLPACAAKEVMSYTNIVYTSDNPGKWEKKVGSHAPRVTVNSGTVTIYYQSPHVQQA